MREFVSSVVSKNQNESVSIQPPSGKIYEVKVIAGSDACDLYYTNGTTDVKFASKSTLFADTNGYIVTHDVYLKVTVTATGGAKIAYVVEEIV